MKRVLSILLLSLLLWLPAGCGQTGDPGASARQTGEAPDPLAGHDNSSGVLIQLSGTSAAASSNSVSISGTTIIITEEADYIISGTLDDGMIIVNAPDTAVVRLTFRDADITSSSSAALYILEADQVFLTLEDGTENSLSNGGTFTPIDEHSIDAPLFSRQDLTLSGGGSLTVTSPAGHGIVCKDDLVFTSGAYTVHCALHGLDVNDSIRITGQTVLTVDAGKDGIHCENTEDASLGHIYISDGVINIDSEGDCISAGAYALIEGGSFDLLAGGGSVNGTKESSDHFGLFMGGGPMGMPPGGHQHTAAAADEDRTSMKGIKAASRILISDGTFRIDSADDSIHTDTSAAINGGIFELASGDDAIHADDTLTVTDGTINITQSYEGLEALHVDVQGGDITLVARDDGLNAAGGTDASGSMGGRDGMFPGRGGMGGGMSSSSNGSITISGGTLYINASGDGIDANGTLAISGGYTVVVGPTQGDTSTLDYDKSAVITGGTFIGTGAAGMAQTFSDPGQGVLSVSVGNQSAGTQITLKDKAGSTLLSYAPQLPFAVVILSTPDMVCGESYTITVGTASATFEAH